MVRARASILAEVELERLNLKQKRLGGRRGGQVGRGGENKNKEGRREREGGRGGGGDVEGGS